MSDRLAISEQAVNLMLSVFDRPVWTRHKVQDDGDLET